MSFFDRVSLVHPVRTEVIGNVKGLDMGETHRDQLPVCRPDIGALVPGAASAVDDDGLIPVEPLNAISKFLEARSLSSGAGILRSADVRFGVEDVGAYLQNQRLLATRGFQKPGEFRRLQVVRGWDGRCGGRRGGGRMCWLARWLAVARDDAEDREQCQ